MRIELSTKIQEQQVVGILELKKLADAGNVDACNTLGTWFLSGLNCSPDVELAAYYFEKAAKGGHTTAMINFALSYAEGRGVPKSFELAELWIRAADECGDGGANVPARQIYISTIGNHEPDLVAYIDYLYDSLYKDNPDMDKKMLTEALLVRMIMDEIGRDVAGTDMFNLKATENDIKSFEMMNDVFYGDPILKTPSAVSDTNKKGVIDNIIANIESFGRVDIAERLLVLYHLCSDKEQKKNIAATGIECTEKFDVDTPLSWLIKAKYEVVKSYFGAFNKDAINGGFISLREKLNSIEDDELSCELTSCEDNLQELLKIRKRLGQAKQYSVGISQKWCQTISEKIVELENATLNERFAQIENDNKALRELRSELKANKQQYELSVVSQWQNKISERIFVFVDELLCKEYEIVKNDYDGLYKMLQTLRQEEQEPDILEKWDALLSKQIGVVQRTKLDELCSSLDGKSYQELTALVRTIKEKYSFDNEISQAYISDVNKFIAVIEKQKLDELVSNIEGWSSSQYAELLGKIDELHFNPANTKQYVELVNQHKNCAEILETCVDENLASWELPKLEEYIKTINGSTLEREQKAELSAKVNSYITLIRECKDKKTLLLLENCSIENVVNHSVEKLEQLRSEVNAHQMLKKEEKVNIIERLDIEISKRKIEKEFTDASGNYDALVAVYTKLSRENLPQEYKDTLGLQIRNGIVEQQKVAISKLMAGFEKRQHGQLKKIKSEIQHFNFDADILNENMALLEQQIDSVENQKLTEICGDVSACTVDDIAKLRDSIRKLGFKDENVRPFKAQIDARYGDLIFEDLSKKCTQWDIMQLATSEDGVSNLLAELQNCGKNETELEPYIKRVSAFLDVQKQLRDEISTLYQNHFNELQPFLVSEMSKLVFPEYSRLNVMCVYKPEAVLSKRSRLSRFKVEGLEQMLFIFDEAPGADTFRGGFCITNLAIHCLTDSGMKYLPLESITEIKTGKLFGSISVSGTSDSFKFSVQEDYNVRNSLANTLLRIISVAKERKRTVANENQGIATAYSAKYDECFANTPIPNDKTFADRALEMKQEEARKAEELAKAPALTPEELIKLIPELVKKYGLSIKYQVVGTQTFINKLPKARAAYATYDQSEIPLMLEDHTIFGSAKDGFVLTNKSIYMHIGGTNGKLSLERIESVFDSYDAKLKMHYMNLNIKDFDTTNGNAYLSYCGDEATANNLIKFWTEVLELFSRGRAIVEPVTPSVEPTTQNNTTASPQSTAVSEDKIPWLCSCGKTNEGKFCPECGSKKESGTPLWKCSCGSYNKGKFCPKCGSKKPL